MEIYTMKVDPKVMGEKHETYGYTMWCSMVEESDYPVMFNTQNPNLFAGDMLVAEDQEVKTSGSGNTYLRLKKVKIKSSGSDPQQDAVPTPASPTQVPRKPVAAASSSTSSSFSSKSSNAYLKDVSNIPQYIWSKLLDHWDVRSLTKDASEAALFWEAVGYHSDELLRMIDHVRGLDSEVKDPFKD